MGKLSISESSVRFSFETKVFFLNSNLKIHMELIHEIMISPLNDKNHSY